MTTKPMQGPALQPPLIDNRNLAALIEQMKEMAPFYTPEWRFSPEDPDPGTALFFLAADMLQENIKRLNRAPLKNFIAFLNMIEVQLQETRPALGYVTFRLNEGVYEPVWIPAGTQVTAQDEDGGEELIYETTQPLLVTPSLLTDLYNVNPKLDRIIRLTGDYPALQVLEPQARLPLFDVTGPNLQEHVLYIRHDELLHATHPSEVRLVWSNTLQRYKQSDLLRALADTELLEWAYPSGGEWVAFDRVVSDKGAVRLVKTRIAALDELEVFGVPGRWIRCRLRAPDGAAPPLLERTLEADKLELATDFYRVDGVAGIAPALMFHNDIELDAAGYHPFGEHFAPYSTFYMGSEEVLGKRGSELELSFMMVAHLNPLRTAPDPEINWRMVMRRHELAKKDPPRVGILKVQWEYWNGDGWMRIPGSQPYEELFSNPPLREAAPQTVKLVVPHDLQPTYVNAQLGHWLRVRVLTMDQIYAPEMIYASPWLTELRLTYRYPEDRLYAAQTLTTHNNMAYRDRTLEARQGGTLFRLFEGLEARSPAVYAGFDAPLRKGPIRLHVSLYPAPPAGTDAPVVEWEYWGRDANGQRWLPLKTVDATAGMTESGTLQFIGPPDMVAGLHFGRERYWLRGVNRDDRYADSTAPYPVARRLELNAVEVRQQRSVRGETPERVAGAYALSAAPVIDAEVWIDETGHLSEHEVLQRREALPEETELIHDSEGLVQRVWVRWQRADSFLGSTPSDRHYMLDGASGLIRFGDGVRGRELPHEGPDIIRVHYRVTAGSKGNVAAGQIDGLQHSIAFIAGVSNSEAAVGGCDTEPLDSALLRGPQRLKHRDRAVTAEDFEWLAREAYADLAKVKCLPNLNGLMRRELGTMTMVVLPRGGVGDNLLFPVVKRQVERHLVERMVGGADLPAAVQVIEPAYLEVSVSAVVAVRTMEEALPTELEILEHLERFLDPEHGHMDGRGWEIGESVHATVFHSLLKSIHAVQFVEKLYLSIAKVEHGTAEEIDPQRQRLYPHGLIVNGKHTIHVNASGAR
ncbi:putative baseplate assembly protein [Paenibacillus sp. IB182496]|uniref:Baseplate assembly protein n=1 Tax=Paenibacillus sabuli TaxID=2772509 RepID=A0A927BYD5_9BACL|nr:putative baseplate assembly protein [Paenibacillus sabuli]MBD2847885.1 putative baseplate assembly protein [Paenibacillus sabuli]